MQGTITCYTSAAATTTTAAPAGVTAIVDKSLLGATTLDFETTAAAKAGTYWFKLTYDGVESDVVTLVIAPAAVSVTGISITPSTAVSIEVGQTVQLTATVAPSNATNKDVSWSSSVNAVATVSSTGLVTAVSEGTIYIRARVDGSIVYSDKVITVLPDPTFVSFDNANIYA